MRDGSLSGPKKIIYIGGKNYLLEHVTRQPSIPDSMLERDMEKTGEIKQGVTPPEDTGEKVASEEQLEDHLTKRAAETAEKQMSSQAPPAGCGGKCRCKPAG